MRRNIIVNYVIQVRRGYIIIIIMQRIMRIIIRQYTHYCSTQARSIVSLPSRSSCSHPLVCSFFLCVSSDYYVPYFTQAVVDMEKDGKRSGKDNAYNTKAYKGKVDTE